MGIYTRLGLNFPTEKFGKAETLTSGAANTINLITINTPKLTDWQIEDVQTGSPARSTYFKNPYTSNLASMNVSISSIKVSANSANLSNVFTAANNFTLAIGSFHFHTNNVSGLNVVTDPSCPSYDTASGFGQMNMMNLTKTDGPQSNTSSILGSFTSLFITDEIQANTNQFIYYDSELANSLVILVGDDGLGNVTTNISSNLSSAEITNIVNYINSTTNQLNTRTSHDKTFYQNTLQVTSDIAFIQQFNNIGNTQKFLLNNVIGTPYLVNNLANTA